jgi:hypothetical protein
MNTLWYNRDMEPVLMNLQHFSLKTRANPIYLKQSDFDTGTYRITASGYYVLSEDIVFHPNPDNNFKPTAQQFNDNVYCINPYRLGFFAAITIETSDVVLDLNGFSISQSTQHNIMQRFFALIELANTPFIPKTGPADFGANIHSATNSIIKNGVLGLSSHHGIHGNNNDHILMHDLTIKDFEVAAISLNGGNHIYIKDNDIQGTNTNISSNAMLSQCLFGLPFLKTIKELYPDAYLETIEGQINIDSIIHNIESETNLFIQSQLNNDSTMYQGLFNNASGLLDGNVYGIVLNSKGPVVGKFKTLSPTNTRNSFVMIENTSINNIISDGLEIIGYGPNNTISDGSYGKDQLVGPVGDIIPFSSIINEDGFYIGNILTNMQLIINKYGKNKKEKGTSNVPRKLIEEMEKHEKPILTLLEEYNMYPINERDAMGHNMKGNAGVFISQGQHIILKQLSIDTIINNGLSNNVSSESSGILLSGTTHIAMILNTINNINSNTNNVETIRYKEENKNIIIH